MKTNLYILIVLVLFKSVSFAGEEGASAVPFLKIPVGARAAALGGAFTAISDDASAIFSNTAGLSLAKSGELMFAHNQWIEGLSGETAAYLHPINSKFALGIGANILLSGSMKKYDLNGAESGEFSYSEGALIAAVSGKIIPRGSVGLGIKTIYQKSESKNVMAYAADAGMICEFYENFRAGLSVENIGTKIKLEEESFSIPSGIKLALAYIPLKYGFITAQIKKYSDENITFSAGSEYGFDISANEAGFLRAGYAFGANKNLASGINFGLGLSLDDFLIDYAFSPMGDFGSSHRVSLRIVFGKKDYKIQKEEEYRPKKKSRKKKEKEDDFFIW